MDAAIQQVRNLSPSPASPLLDEVGLRSALQWYVDGVAKSSGIAVTLDVQAPDFPRPAPELETAIFRIIQEALTNVFRHSGGAGGARSPWKQLDGQVFVVVRTTGRASANRLARRALAWVSVG